MTVDATHRLEAVKIHAASRTIYVKLRGDESFDWTVYHSPETPDGFISIGGVNNASYRLVNKKVFEGKLGELATPVLRHSELLNLVLPKEYVENWGVVCLLRSAAIRNYALSVAGEPAKNDAGWINRYDDAVREWGDSNPVDPMWSSGLWPKDAERYLGTLAHDAALETVAKRMHLLAPVRGNLESAAIASSLTYAPGRSC